MYKMIIIIIIYSHHCNYIYNKVVPRHNFISDSLRESTINQIKLYFILDEI